MEYIRRLVAAFGLFVISTGNGAAVEQTFEIIVAPQTDAPLRENDAIAVLQVLVNKMSLSCGTLRVRAGFQELPTQFSGPADMSTDAKRKRYRDTGTSVQIVPSISRCPAPPAAGEIFGGCSPRGGPIILRYGPATTERGRASLAQKAAHEIGHGQGLIGSFPGYSLGHNPSSGALMYRAANASRWGMNQTECNTYYARQLFPPEQPRPVTEDELQAQNDQVTNDATEDDILLVPDMQPEPGTPVVSDGQEIDDFLRGEWHGQLPIAEIEENREELLSAAEQAIDENNVELWPGSVVVVAYAGQQAAAERVAKVLAFDPGEFGFTLDEYQAFQFNDAKIRGAGAVSYIVYRAQAGDYVGEDAGQAFELLRDNLSPSRTLGLPFADDGRDTRVLAQEVALNATSGLTLLASVSDEALSMLEEHRQANLVGAYDLGVDDSYFKSLDQVITRNRQMAPANMSLHDMLAE